MRTMRYLCVAAALAAVPAFAQGAHSPAGKVGPAGGPATDWVYQGMQVDVTVDPYAILTNTTALGASTITLAHPGSPDTTVQTSATTGQLSFTLGNNTPVDLGISNVNDGTYALPSLTLPDTTAASHNTTMTAGTAITGKAFAWDVMLSSTIAGSPATPTTAACVASSGSSPITGYATTTGNTAGKLVNLAAGAGTGTNSVYAVTVDAGIISGANYNNTLAPKATAASSPMYLIVVAH